MSGKKGGKWLPSRATRSVEGQLGGKLGRSGSGHAKPGREWMKQGGQRWTVDVQIYSDSAWSGRSKEARRGPSMCQIYSDSSAKRPGKEKGGAGGAPAKRDHRVGGKPRTQGGLPEARPTQMGRRATLASFEISLAKVGSKKREREGEKCRQGCVLLAIGFG